MLFDMMHASLSGCLRQLYRIIQSYSLSLYTVHSWQLLIHCAIFLLFSLISLYVVSVPYVWISFIWILVVSVLRAIVSGDAHNLECMWSCNSICQTFTNTYQIFFFLLHFLAYNWTQYFRHNVPHKCVEYVYKHTYTFCHHFIGKIIIAIHLRKHDKPCSSC